MKNFYLQELLRDAVLSAVTSLHPYGTPPPAKCNLPPLNTNTNVRKRKTSYHPDDEVSRRTNIKADGIKKKKNFSGLRRV
jgi:hypothetical protein